MQRSAQALTEWATGQGAHRHLTTPLNRQQVPKLVLGPRPGWNEDHR